MRHFVFFDVPPLPRCMRMPAIKRRLIPPPGFP
jgi:hypothetical protein